MIKNEARFEICVNEETKIIESFKDEYGKLLNSTNIQKCIDKNYENAGYLKTFLIEANENLKSFKTLKTLKFE